MIVTATEWVSETAPEVAVELTVMLAVVGGGGGGVEFPPPHDTISMHHPIASASRLSRNAGCCLCWMLRRVSSPAAMQPAEQAGKPQTLQETRFSTFYILLFTSLRPVESALQRNDGRMNLGANPSPTARRGSEMPLFSSLKAASSAASAL